MRVLVTEDDRSVAYALQRGLAAEGYAVDVAFDGAEGLWFGQENPYDVIVLDIMLPKLDGLEVCARLRAGGSTVPIFMLTARTGVRSETAALDTGADDFLAKPFSYPCCWPDCGRWSGAAWAADRPCSRQVTCGWTRSVIGSAVAGYRSS